MIFFFVFNKNTELDETVAEKKIFDCDSIDYSRLSLFNATKDRVSLNIPESWEGKYRLKEEGNKAIFYYLLESGSANEMFVINKKIESSNDDKVVCEKEDLKVVLDIYDLESEEYSDKIIETWECVIESIKCY